MSYFYILFSETLDKFYIGHTTEQLEERLRKHLSDHSGYTARTKDWTIVYFEEYQSKSLAYRRELEVKKWKRKINFNPDSHIENDDYNPAIAKY